MPVALVSTGVGRPPAAGFEAGPSGAVETLTEVVLDGTIVADWPGSTAVTSACRTDVLAGAEGAPSVDGESEVGVVISEATPPNATEPGARPEVFELNRDAPEKGIEIPLKPGASKPVPLTDAPGNSVATETEEAIASPELLSEESSGVVTALMLPLGRVTKVIGLVVSLA